jgi:hypothetical protein
MMGAVTPIARLLKDRHVAGASMADAKTANTHHTLPSAGLDGDLAQAISCAGSRTSGPDLQRQVHLAGACTVSSFHEVHLRLVGRQGLKTRQGQIHRPVASQRPLCDVSAQAETDELRRFRIGGCTERRRVAHRAPQSGRQRWRLVMTPGCSCGQGACFRSSPGKRPPRQSESVMCVS